MPCDPPTKDSAIGRHHHALRAWISDLSVKELATGGVSEIYICLLEWRNHLGFVLWLYSVRGGFRPSNQQTHLLKQMEKVARTYKARFVVSISELGEDDPLMQNATQQFSSLKVPWYTTKVSKGHEEGYFLKQVNIPYGKTLDIIGVNTGLLQDFVCSESMGETGNDQLYWLTRTLEATSSNWRIVVGFHPLVVCEETDEKVEAKRVLETLQDAFLKFEVNAYLSGQGCTCHVHQGSIAYTGNPGPIEKGPYLEFSNGRSVFRRELVNGFLLHRVSSLEIVSISFFLKLITDFVYCNFVSSTGVVVHTTVLQQKGKEAM
ncbi:hypothetical protein FNV43_RR03409 [Rhamnella rubrinervis]|uniref:Uncharacterized protein n=1 Tax=Rhamnella rubrinervis TaxID=2594499 RepID=A0A8K0MNP0_9ROSA|nr:hypothetical protein FNV43_RR03409 [Rhamnella rubrinervis]